MRGVLKPREERIENDAYFTPEPLADEICRRLVVVLPPQRWIWDPCCGDLAFVNAAMDAWPSTPNVVGTDLPLRDFLKAPSHNGWTLIVSNPPYLLAEQFVRRALAFAEAPQGCAMGGHVAFLLRLSFLAGQRRLALYEQHPLRYLIPITPRPSFTPDGKTDASEYGVFVWQRGYTGLPEILPHIRWKR